MAEKSPWRGDRTLDALYENVALLTGIAGDGRYKAMTQLETARLKLANPIRKRDGSEYSLAEGIAGLEGFFNQKFPEKKVEAPTKPENLKATGGYSFVLLEWKYPAYQGHSLTEIYRGEEDNIANAALVGTAPGQVYSDPVNPGFSGFYWIRFVNEKNDPGPYNAISGTPAHTTDVDAVFSTIETQLNRSPLLTTFRDGINSRISAFATTVSGEMDSFKNDVNKNIEGLSAKGTRAFLDMWEKKVSAAGITTGIGIVAGTDSYGQPVSQVAISASQFFIYDPKAPASKVFPFIVSGGRVLINDLVVRDAVIKNLQGMHISADTIAAGATLTAPVITSGTIKNGKFTVDSNGNMTANDAVLNSATMIDGVIQNAVVQNFRAQNGTLDNVVIKNNCVIEGELSAANLVGDLATSYVLQQGNSIYIGTASYERNVAILASVLVNPGVLRINGVTASPNLEGIITMPRAYGTIVGGSLFNPIYGVDKTKKSWEGIAAQIWTIPARTPTTVEYFANDQLSPWTNSNTNVGTVGTRCILMNVYRVPQASYINVSNVIPSAWGGSYDLWQTASARWEGHGMTLYDLTNRYAKYKGVSAVSADEMVRMINDFIKVRANPMDTGLRPEFYWRDLPTAYYTLGGKGTYGKYYSLFGGIYRNAADRKWMDENYYYDGATKYRWSNARKNPDYY